MNKTINILKWISVIGGAIAGLFGAWDDALTYLLVLNAVDFEFCRSNTISRKIKEEQRS